MRRICFVLFSVSSLCGAVYAAPLAAGDSAPPLRVGEWIRPSPVNLFDWAGQNPKPFFLIEFWATWCEPCRAMMPHLAELQNQYAEAGLVIIGVSNEPPSVVHHFTQSMGGAAGYALVTDTPQRDVYNAYMRPVGSPGIPHAFLIDRDGNLVWHGVPSAKEIDGRIERLAGESYTLKSEILAERAERLMARYFAAKTRSANPDETAALGERIVEWGSARPELLREFAWRLLTEPGLEPRDVDTALRAATRAHEARPQDFRILEALALAHYAAGDLDQAASWQAAAIDACPEQILQLRMKETLDKFRAETTSNTTLP